MSGEGVLLFDSSASAAAADMGDLLKQSHAGVAVNYHSVVSAFDRLCQSDAESAEDALALVSVAHRLLSCAPIPEAAPDAFNQERTVFLLTKAIAALESVSGEKASTFIGYGN